MGILYGMEKEEGNLVCVDTRPRGIRKQTTRDKGKKFEEGRMSRCTFDFFARKVTRLRVICVHFRTESTILA